MQRWRHCHQKARRLLLTLCAVAAFHVLGCSGLARCDFFYTNEGEVIINEVNTMPGFTGTSVYPKLWQASGISYTELISALIDTALSS